MEIKKTILELSKLIVPNNLEELKVWCEFNKIKCQIQKNFDGCNDIIQIMSSEGELLDLRPGYSLYLINGIPEFAEIPEYLEYGNIFNKYLK